jgi:hypothetical protein
MKSLIQYYIRKQMDFDKKEAITFGLASFLTALFGILSSREGAHRIPFLDPGKESVRFDEENCDIFCVADHAYFESHKTEYTAWKKDRMGEKAFNLLMVRAHITGKRDDKLQVMLIKNS